MTKQQFVGDFSNLGLKESLQAILKQKQFIQPTPIQAQVIPGALEGNDVIGIAQTGTGKTLAFGLPMIQQIAIQKGQGLIIVPTRELALQVEASLQAIGKGFGLSTACIIGGVSQNNQVRSLKKRPHIVIATPGRLDDLIQQGLFSLEKITHVTLDEADRMLDEGFLPQIKKFLRMLPKERQTMLFSATMPKTIADLAGEFMHSPMRVEIAPQGTSSKNISQELFIIKKDQKFELLLDLLKKEKDATVLVFSRTKHGAKKIAKRIRDNAITATEIHSNRTQAQRKKALEGFTKGRFRVMVATDIAARGIDVSRISLVVNYDLPDNVDDYVHRIGRTGRAGRTGKAISFATASEKSSIRKIEKLIRKTLPVTEHELSVPLERVEKNTFEKSGNRNRAVSRRRRRRSGARTNSGRRYKQKKKERA